ncbi:hypothetical protein AC1031_012446 [Aphanomyces cochlioides]|nr:hypothetical protein AC1031_012446 [Aphanomyces cochlioides]
MMKRGNVSTDSKTRAQCVEDGGEVLVDADGSVDHIKANAAHEHGDCHFWIVGKHGGPNLVKGWPEASHACPQDVP